VSDGELVQQLFDNLNSNPFALPKVNMTPQELAAYAPTSNPQPVGWIGPDAVDSVAIFAASIRPVILVSSLPDLPDTDYPVGQFVYNLSDDPPRLYKNDADSWVAGVGTEDLQANSITTGKIAAAAIGTSELAAGAVTADILAATIILTSLLKTASSGRRVQIEAAGITLYDTDESVLVRIPTNGDPVYVSGDINAGSLVSNTSAEFRTAVSLAGAGAMTVQSGVSDPSTKPTLVNSVDSLELTSTPTGTPTGIAYDAAAGSFLIAADPASGYVAHEYDATTGVLIRHIAATGSVTTYTTTLGATSHVSDAVVAFSGSTDTHVGTKLTIPAGLTNVRITKVAVWMAGYLGTCDTRFGIWDTSGNLLSETGTYTVAEHMFGAGNSVLHNVDLTSPYSIAAGTTIRAGFRRTNTTDGSQWDRDLGASKITSLANGTTADGTSWSDTAGEKPNVYVTYTYDVDTRLETSPMIGIATDGTYIYTLDQTGVVWKYDRTTGAYVANSGVQTAITGAKANAGMFYDATAAELIITTATGTGAAVYPKFVRVNKTTLAVSASVYSASAGTTFNGSATLFRGGARLADPLNASAATYWIATASGASAVYAYTFSGTTATQTSDRDFGSVASMSTGLTHDGTQFRGYSSSSPTKIWKFSNWDWTTASALYWVCYAWYDDAGTTHETAVSPRTSITMRRRERVQVQQPAIPTGGADDPDKVRIYMKPNATDPGAGAFKLQATDALTSRYLTTYASSAAADGAGTAFPSGTPATIASALATASGGWLLGGGGRIVMGGTAFPANPTSGDISYRIDRGMWFKYDGTRWLCTCPHSLPTDVWNDAGLSATDTFSAEAPTPDLLGGSDIWLQDHVTQFLVAGGGTALGASHKWDGTFSKSPTGDTNTTLNTIAISSGSSAVWRTSTTSINALLNNGTIHFVFKWGWTKTGTPGQLFARSVLTYRIVAT
jgi:hypothetical protein